jgi:hypothetical protein
MSLQKIHQLIATAWPVHGIEEDEACGALILNVLAEARKLEDPDTRTHRPYRYEEARDLLRDIIEDFRILSGDKMGPSDVSWQDVAGTAMTNLQVLAWRMEEAREGNVAGGPVVFPSPDDFEPGDQHAEEEVKEEDRGQEG